MSKEPPERIRRAVQLFLRELSKSVKVEAAYLFGSYARGDWLETSDIDLIIVSPDFRGRRFTERLDLLEALQWRLGITPHIEALAYTPEEFQMLRDRSVALRDASRYWIRLI